MSRVARLLEVLNKRFRVWHQLQLGYDNKQQDTVATISAGEPEKEGRWENDRYHSTSCLRLIRWRCLQMQYTDGLNREKGTDPVRDGFEIELTHGQQYI